MDGNKGGSWPDNWYCNHIVNIRRLNNNKQPWWMVDLQGYFDISYIVITPRSDDYPINQLGKYVLLEIILLKMS